MEELDVYELFVTITRLQDGGYDWGIGQEVQLTEFDGPSFEFIAGGQEDTREEAARRVSEQIAVLFKEV